MKTFTIRLDDELDSSLEQYIKKNKLSSKNIAIKKMIEYFIRNNEFIASYKELDRKLERLLKLESLNNSLLEQLFANHGFTMNLDKKTDKILKEAYENIRKKYYIFMD